MQNKSRGMKMEIKKGTQCSISRRKGAEVNFKDGEPFLNIGEMAKKKAYSNKSM